MIEPRVLAMLEAERHEVREVLRIAESQDDVMPPERWGALVLRHAGLAMPHTSLEEHDESRFVRQMVRLMWLATAALEAHVRREDRRRVAGPDEAGRGRQY